MRKNLFLILFLILIGSESVFALPIFARRYQTSCTTCHTIIPKLNPFGIAFRNNGYRIPVSDEKLLQSQDLSLGAPAWKKLWPKAVWPGAISGLPPVAIRVLTDADIEPSQPVHLNFDFPDGVELYFAGPAGDTFSFFGNVFLQGSTNSLFLDRAYGQFRLSPEKTGANWLNLKLGRIDTRAEPFSSTYRKSTVQDFNTGEYRAVSDGFTFHDHDAGIELWGAATGSKDRGGLEYGAGITQGTSGKAESNNSKDQYWSALYKFGGLGVAGSRNEKDSLASTETYRERSIAIGTFGYRGKRHTVNEGGAEDQYTRTGVKVDAYLDDLNVFGAVVSGHDNIRVSPVESLKTSAYFAEADYMLLPWVMPIVRFERTKYDEGPAVREWIASTVLSLRANVRVVVEGHFFRGTANPAASSVIYEYGPPPTANDGMIRLDFAF